MALIVGIDLGRKSSHDTVILRRETGLESGRGFRFRSSPEGFEKLFRKIDAARKDGEPVDPGDPHAELGVLRSPGADPRALGEHRGDPGVGRLAA